MLGWIVGVLLACEAGARIALAARVILRRCTPSQTMAWLLVLTFVPVVSSVAYLLIGENRLGSRRAARYVRSTAQVRETIERLVRERDQNWTSRALGYESLERLLASSSGIPALKGNRLMLLESTDAFLRDLIAEIDAATHHVHIVTFIWTTRGQAAQVGEAVARAAARGVMCRVLVDDVGSAEFTGSGLEARMRKAGARVARCLPVNPLRFLLARIDIRNHRKIAVIDGRVAFTGSHNIADPDFKMKQLPKVGRWVDATVRVEGPAVHALQGVFLRDWAADSEEHVDHLDAYFPRVVMGEGGSLVHVMPSGPGDRPEVIHHALLAMIHDAREELVMTTPYFVPDEATRAALQIAARCGVKVTLVLPERNDHRLVQAAGRSYYLELLEAGVRIAHYRAGLLHSKTCCVDRKMAVITSANLDMRSFFVNLEASLFVFDEAFSREVRLMQERYLLDSVPVTVESWRGRPVHRRLVENVCQVLGPLL